MEEVNLREKVLFVSAQLLAIFCIITPTVSDSCIFVNACKCEFTNGSVIDLTSLGSESGPRWKEKAENDSYIYYYNPCYNFKLGKTGCANGVAVCQVFQNQTEYQNCGEQEHVFFMWDNKKSAVVVNYRSQDGTRKTNVTLMCSKDPVESSKLTVWGEKGKNTGRYEMTLHSICACPDGCGTGLSFGSGLVIIFFVCVLLYLCLGIIYNHLARGAQGCELIPHYEFWKDFPLLVKDGCVYISSGCRRETSYERI